MAALPRSRSDHRNDASSVASGVSSEYHSTYTPGDVTLPGGRHDDNVSTGNDSPTSFHTPNNLDDSDYQDNEEVDYALGTSPPDERQSSFYLDGRPRPHGPDDSDDDSCHSNDEAGYVTATQPVTRRFVDPYQPKLLLAEDDVKPSEEKLHLSNEYEPADRERMTSPDDHEELHREHHHTRRRKRTRNNNGSKAAENTPLLRGGPQSESNRDEEDTTCCVIL